MELQAIYSSLSPFPISPVTITRRTFAPKAEPPPAVIWKFKATIGFSEAPGTKAVLPSTTAPQTSSRAATKFSSSKPSPPTTKPGPSKAPATRSAPQARSVRFGVAHMLSRRFPPPSPQQSADIPCPPRLCIESKKATNCRLTGTMVSAMLPIDRHRRARHEWARVKIFFKAPWTC